MNAPAVEVPRPPLSVAVVTETYPPEVNGVAMTVGRLVQGLRARGHRVQVIRPRQPGEEANLAPDGDATLGGLPLPGYPGLRFGLPAKGKLLRAWRQERPDVVHLVTEGPLGWSALAAARRLGIPATSGFHTNFDRYSIHYGFGVLRPAVAAYLRTFHRRTLATLAPTVALAAALAGEGIPGVKVVGRGVDTALFDPQRRDGALRASWGVAEGGLAVLSVGRVAAEKNLPLTLKAFAAIRAQRPDARLVVVGDGPLRRSLEATHPDHHFAGVRVGEDLAAHYASGDLFLFPSLTETFGNVTLEALASGLPTVAYRSAAAAELIRDGEHGVTVNPGDEAAFVAAAVGVATDAAGRQRLAQAARAKALTCSWDQVVTDFETVLRQASGGTAGAYAAALGSASSLPMV